MNQPTTQQLVSAWQAALAAERQAVFGYGLLGPRASTDAALAASCAAAHGALRDTAAQELSAMGQTPVPPLADYPALYPVTDSAAARRLAVRLEADCASAWRYLFAQSVANMTFRRIAQANLTASAVRGVRWRRLVDPRHAAPAFPGL